MILMDLLLPYYRSERVLEDPVFTAGQGMYYDAEKGKICDGQNYSNKEKYKFSKLMKWTGITGAAVSGTLLATLAFSSFKFDKSGNKINKIHKGLAALSIPVFLSYTRNLDKAAKWAIMQEKYSEFK